jgi:predicted DNA-binding protein
MIRTSILLPPTLHQRLLLASKRSQKTITDLIRDLLDQSLARQEQTSMEQTYQALERVRGICKDNIKDASTTINDVLYGENGAWKGTNE